MEEPVKTFAVLAFFLLLAVLIVTVVVQDIRQRRYAKNADEIIAQTFRGKYVATYKIPRFGRALTYKQITAGATAWHFVLVDSQTDITGTVLIFEHVDLEGRRANAPSSCSTRPSRCWHNAIGTWTLEAPVQKTVG